MDNNIPENKNEADRRIEMSLYILITHYCRDMIVTVEMQH